MPQPGGPAHSNGYPSRRHRRPAKRRDNRYLIEVLQGLCADLLWALGRTPDAVAWGLWATCKFLSEQPGQFRHIQWGRPFETAQLTLITVLFVALFVVGLSTVDTLISFLLIAITRAR